MSPLPVMVNSTLLFDIVVNGEHLGHISFQLFAKFQRQQKMFIFWALDRKDLAIRVPVFTELFQGLYARVVTSHVMMTLVQVQLQGEVWWWELHPEAYKTWLLVHGKYWTLHKWFPVFHLHYQDCVVGWQESTLWQDKRGLKYLGSHGILCVLEWENQKEDHNWRLWTTPINFTYVLF